MLARMVGTRVVRQNGIKSRLFHFRNDTDCCDLTFLWSFNIIIDLSSILTNEEDLNKIKVNFNVEGCMIDERTLGS